MDVADLQSFAQVVKYGGFTAAERATGEAKAKLSCRVARLEADLGTRLLERSTRNLRVTDIGQEVFRQCEIIAEGIENTQAIVARSRMTVAGSLRISCPPGLARYLGPHLLSSFLGRYPEVKLEMHLSGHMVDLIRERFDASIHIETDEIRNQTLITRKLGAIEWILVASPALAESLEPWTVERLAISPILSRSERADGERWVLRNAEGRRYVVNAEPRLVSNDSVLLREAAVDGLGIALLPAMTCALEIARGDLVRILPDWHVPEGSIHLMFTAKQGMSNALRAFIDHVVMTLSPSLR